jgi:hypothetical protein
MQLMMYIGNDLIESIPVDVTRLSVPGYLGGYKRQLKQRHQALLKESAQQPEFLVINLQPANTKVTSSANYSVTTTAGVYC